MDASAHRYMQQPTHSTLKVVTSADARAALFLVECQLMQPVRRRPDDAEKAQIGHGQVFIWLDGAKGETGLERWTDGRSWGPSRCRDDFLIYEEKTGEHRLTKSTYTARRNTHDDPGALWHLIAYYYADETNDLIDMYTHPTYQPYTSRMAPGYFVSNRKDKSRKAKEVPAPVDPSPLSRYDALVASLQTVVSPTSPATQPPFTNSSPYPSSAHTHSSHTLPSPISAGRSNSQAQLVAQYESFSLNGSSQQRVTPPRSSPVADRRMAPIQMTSSQQRRHELTPLKTSFGNDSNNSGSNSRELATDPASHALTRHTAHDPKSFKKTLAADYHRLPPPAGGSNHYTGGGGGIRDRDHHGRGRSSGGGGDHYHNGYGYAASSPSSSSSPGLSPTSSGSSPIEVDMEPLPPSSYQAFVDANERNIPRPASVGVPVLAPTPVRAYSASRSPATPQPGSQGVPSPAPTFAYREPYTTPSVALRGVSPAGVGAAVAVSNAGASSKQFERGGAEMMVIDDSVTPAGGVPAPPPRRIEDEKMIQRLSRGLGQFF